MSEVGNVLTGVAVLKDWLGDEAQPVPHDTAVRRSSICLVCPLNSHGKWWLDAAKNAVADSITRYIEVKNGLRIYVPNEELLFMCSACGCALPLKVNTPISHILAHTSPEQFAKFDKSCWILFESLPTQ